MTDRITPAPSMDASPIPGLAALQAHLQHLVDDATLPVQADLVDHVELQLTSETLSPLSLRPQLKADVGSSQGTNISPLLTTLLPPIVAVLKTTSQYPGSLISLTIKLLQPLSFAQTLCLAENHILLAALRSPLVSVNQLALVIIHKAAATPEDAATFSSLPEIVEDVVRLWLQVPSVSVGERAVKVLGDILETDCDGAVSNGESHVPGRGLAKGGGLGEGRLWRLIFQNHSILSLIQKSCTLNQEPSRSTHAVTISQGRLLRLLPRLAHLNLPVLSQPYFPDLFPLSDLTAQHVGRGLLQWAALGMVAKSDTLMHMTLVDFFEAFVSVMRSSRFSRGAEDAVGSLVRTAVRGDDELDAALRSLPD